MFVITTCFLSFCLTAYAEIRPSTVTQCGTAQGTYMLSRGGREFAAYLGIPYAEPPLGNLRFEPPKPITNCPVVFDASKESEACIQPNIEFPNINKDVIGSENCLHLNIFSPKVNSSRLLPVMVYFYEGSWIVSSSNLGLHGPEYFMDEDIVLVTCNNRNSIFGYMSTEDDVVPGNMALKDQAAVLQYIQDNIEAFNGDSNSVTLFGSSAGASTINLHMRSPLSKDLFQRGISQSGTANSAYSITGVGSSLKYTKGIAARVGCDSNCTYDMVKCLKEVKAETLIQEQMIYLFTSQTDPKALFHPVVEPRFTKGAFITETPLMTTTSHDWMTGFNTADASFKYLIFAEGDIDKNLADLDQNWDIRGPNTLMFDDTSTDTVRKARLIKKFYFGNDPISTEKKHELINMHSHFYVTNPMIMDAQKNTKPTYVYQFDHLGQYSRGKQLIGKAGHGDENIYLFGQNITFPHLSFNQIDMNISKLMLKLWVNFATYGTPTPSEVSNNPQDSTASRVSWEPFGDNRNYLLIQTDRLSMQKDLFIQEYNFWANLSVTDELRSHFDDLGYLKVRQT